MAIALRVEDADALPLQKEQEETDKYILRRTEHGKYRGVRKLINIRLWRSKHESSTVDGLGPV